MKRLSLLAVFALVSVGISSASESRSFYEQLTPAEKQAAGIEQLTPEQQAALGVLANRWVERKAQDAIDHARAKAVAQVRAEVKAEADKQVGLTKPRTEEDVIRTRVAGAFRGWSKGTRFTLENGQTWVVDDTDSRFFPRRDNAEVEIRPSSFGSWKLTLLPEGLWVRVKRVN
jgi:hypothetical protein